MAHGLKVRDNQGKVILDTSDRITRHVYTSAQTAAGGNSGALPQLTGKLSGDFCVPINIDAFKTSHTVSRSVDTITWTTWTDVGAFLTPGTCVIFSFAYT